MDPKANATGFLENSVPLYHLLNFSAMRAVAFLRLPVLPTACTPQSRHFEEAGEFYMSSCR